MGIPYLNFPGFYNGRLTLQSGTAITTADQLAKTEVYLTPFRGNQFSLYDGDSWQTVPYNQVTIPVPATTDLQFDVYAWLYTPTNEVRVETVDWLNDTTRAVPLGLFNGVVVKGSGVTLDPTRKFIGVCRTTGVMGQTEDSTINRLVRNYANYIRRTLHLNIGYVNVDADTVLNVTNTGWAEVPNSAIRYLTNNENPVDVTLNYTAEAPSGESMQIGVRDNGATSPAIACLTDKKVLQAGSLRYSVQKAPGTYTVSAMARVSGGTGKLYAGFPFNGGSFSPPGLVLQGAIFG